MGDNNILVQSGSLSGLLESFKTEMDNLDKLYSKIDSELSSTKAIWEGNASDANLSKIEKFKEVFDSIKAQNEKYVNFLNTVIEKYTDIDDREIKAINSNMGSYDINYSGRK